MSVLFDEVVRRKASENTRSRITILGDKAVLVNTLTYFSSSDGKHVLICFQSLI